MFTLFNNKKSESERLNRIEKERKINLNYLLLNDRLKNFWKWIYDGYSKPKFLIEDCVEIGIENPLSNKLNHIDNIWGYIKNIDQTNNEITLTKVSFDTHNDNGEWETLYEKETMTFNVKYLMLMYEDVYLAHFSGYGRF